MNVRLIGEANDYVGKGMAGGEIVIVPPPGQDLDVGSSADLCWLLCRRRQALPCSSRCPADAACGRDTEQHLVLVQWTVPLRALPGHGRKRQLP